MIRNATLSLLVILSSCSSEPAGTIDGDLAKKTRICSSDAWCWQTPPQTGNDLFGIAKAGSKRVVVGDAQTFLETTDGSRFTGTSGVGWDAVRDVWQDEDGTLWAAGRNGAVWHRAGTSWARTWLPIDEDLVSIFGLDHHHIWVASVFGRVFRYDGSGWTAFDTGIAPTWTQNVWASSDSDVWIAGANYVRRWDGKTWHAISCSYEGSSRFRVWGAGGDVWIASETRPGILKADRKTDFAQGVSGESIFFGVVDVDGTSSSDVWFAGPNDLVHWDGKAFAPVQLPDDIHMFPFTRVRAIARDEVWLLGKSGALARFDGSAWRRIGPKIDPAPPHRLMWRERGDLWEIFPNEVRRFDGTAWTSELTTTGRILDAVLVGRHVLRYDNPSHAQYVVRASDGGTWKDVGAPFVSGDDGTVLWASALDDVWAGTGAELFHFDGATWSSIQLPLCAKCTPRVRVSAIHGTSKANVWMIGTYLQEPILARFDGKTWKVSSLPDTGKGLFVTGPSHGWVGAMGKLFEVTGEAIVEIDLDGHQDIRRFAGTASDLYATGGSGFASYNVPTSTSVVERAYGYVLHYDGHTWHEEVSGSGNAINDVAHAPDGSTWLLTSQGMLRKSR